MEIKCCSEVKIPLCIIIVLFGMGSWIAINGIWVELPILVDQLPEGWNLPSYMTIIIQIANIGPITITVLNLLKPNNTFERPVVYIMVVIGATASILLALFWKETSYIGGVKHSTALLVLMFFMSLVDCTSSVVFLPFMNIFNYQYLTAYYIGEGFSGLLPSLVSLAQGVGKIECVNTSIYHNDTNTTEFVVQGVYLPPLFPVMDFFLFIFAMMMVCGLAFILLNHLPYCKEEYAREMPHPNYSPGSLEDSYELDPGHAGSSQDRILDKNSKHRIEDPVSVQEMSPKMSKLGYIFFLILIGWVNALTNGVLPSIQSYACLPYGSESYHLAVTLSNISNPMACFFAFFIPVKSGMKIFVITLVGTLASAYIMVLAVYSPEPPLLESSAGGILVVLAFVIVYLLLTFTKVAIATLFRMEGKKALLWCGAMTQLGSAIGAAVMFVTVNVYNLFVQKYPCT